MCTKIYPDIPRLCSTFVGQSSSSVAVSGSVSSDGIVCSRGNKRLGNSLSKNKIYLF